MSSRVRNRNSERYSPTESAPYWSTLSTSMGSSMLAESSMYFPSVVMGSRSRRVESSRSMAKKAAFLNSYSLMSRREGLMMTLPAVPSMIMVLPGSISMADQELAGQARLSRE